MYLHQKQRFLIAFGRVVIVQDGALTSSFLLIQHHTSTTIPLHTETLINREPYRSRSLDEGFVIRPLRVVRSTCGVEEGSSSWREALRAVLVASGRRRSGLYPWPRPPSSTGSEHPWDRGESYSAALTRQVHAGLVQLPKLHHPVAVLDGVLRLRLFGGVVVLVDAAVGGDVGGVVLLLRLPLLPGLRHHVGVHMVPAELLLGIRPDLREGLLLPLVLICDDDVRYRSSDTLPNSV